MNKDPMNCAHGRDIFERCPECDAAAGVKTHVWKSISLSADECTQCGTIARVGDSPLKDGQPCPGAPEAQPQVADALTVDVQRGTISLGSHRSFVAKPIARAVQKLIDDAKEGAQ